MFKVDMKGLKPQNCSKNITVVAEAYPNFKMQVTTSLYIYMSTKPNESYEDLQNSICA